jgi:hypothetical protein
MSVFLKFSVSVDLFSEIHRPLVDKISTVNGFFLN